MEWDELDYLLIDSPPGTSDEHMGIVTLLSDAGIDGGIIGTLFLFYHFQITFQLSYHSLRSCPSRCSEAVTILCKVELKSDWRSREYVWFYVSKVPSNIAHIQAIENECCRFLPT